MIELQQEITAVKEVMMIPGMEEVPVLQLQEHPVRGLQLHPPAAVEAVPVQVPLPKQVQMIVQEAALPAVHQPEVQMIILQAGITAEQGDPPEENNRMSYFQRNILYNEWRGR